MQKFMVMSIVKLEGKHKTQGNRSGLWVSREA